MAMGRFGRLPAAKAVFTLVAATALTGLPAQAQTAGERRAGDPIVIEQPGLDAAARARQDRIEELERLLIAAQSETEAVQRQLFEARQQITQLEGQVRALTEQLEAAAQAAPPPAAAAPTAPDLPAADQFAAAVQHMRNGRLADAEAGFTAFLAAPGGAAGQQAEARFWLAEIMMAQGRSGEAAGAFAQFLQRHPRHAMAADALARLGLALGRAGQPREGCAALRDVAAQYPAAATITRNRVTAAQRELRCPA